MVVICFGKLTDMGSNSLGRSAGQAIATLFQRHVDGCAVG